MACAAPDVEDSVSCSVCCERYDDSSHVPKMLPCEHTFCGSCISEIIDLAYEYDGDAKCPMCRSTIPSVSDVRTNLQVREIAEAISKQKPVTVEKTSMPVSSVAHPSAKGTDCSQPPCTVSINGPTEGSHRAHEIVATESRKLGMKKRLKKFFGGKFRSIKKSRIMGNARHKAEGTEPTSAETEPMQRFGSTLSLYDPPTDRGMGMISAQTIHHQHRHHRSSSPIDAPPNIQGTGPTYAQRRPMQRFGSTLSLYDPPTDGGMGMTYSRTRPRQPVVSSSPSNNPPKAQGIEMTSAETRRSQLYGSNSQLILDELKMRLPTRRD